MEKNDVEEKVTCDTCKISFEAKAMICDACTNRMQCTHLHDSNCSVIQDKCAKLKENDVVKEPDHYKHGTFEVIDELLIVFGVEATLTFCKMNAWKYRARAPFKGKPKEDMEKANRYLEMAYDITQIRQEYPEADGYEVVFLLKGNNGNKMEDKHVGFGQ